MDIRWYIKDIAVKIAVHLLKWTGWYEDYWAVWRTYSFKYTESRGLHILPVNFYSPIPDTRKLPESLWQPKKDMPWIDMGYEKTVALLERLAGDYQAEYQKLADTGTSFVGNKAFRLENGRYGCGDAELLYSIVRHLKPGKIIEIGAGLSTLIMARALRQNGEEDHAYHCNFISIDPYPSEYLHPLPVGVSELRKVELQSVPLSEFRALKAGDILFIDSSHVAKIGSDVVYEYLEILPSLPSGVFVHIHDIFLPHEYPSEWYKTDMVFWNEQYLLQAFLSLNSEFEVIAPMYAMHLLYPEVMEKIFPSSKIFEFRPSSFWIKRK